MGVVQNLDIMEVMLDMFCMKSLATVTAMFSYCHCWVLCFSVFPFKMSQSLFIPSGNVTAV